MVQPARLQSYKKGHWAESLAKFYFLIKGYKVLVRRYKTPVGEIDLILQKDKALIFVEVKLRRSIDEALESISHKNKKRVEKAALHFIAHNTKYQGFGYQFDVFAVIMRGRFVPNGFRHLDNAWEGSMLL